MDATWTPLDLYGGPNRVPQLFISYSFTTTTYSIFVTDLTSIWGEHLQKQQINARAVEQDTSIDPTEDCGRQMRLFLNTIKQALDNGKGTERYISRAKDSEGFFLITTTPVQGSSALKWRFRLMPLPQHILSQHLILPLLETAWDRKNNVDNLIQNLKDKDHVITKLLDTLDQAGLDISEAFPSAIQRKSSKKVNAREAAGQHVRGLAVFDEASWRSTSDAVSGAEYSLGAVVQQIAIKPQGSEDTIFSHGCESHVGWPDRLENFSPTATRSSPATPARAESSSSPISTNGTKEDFSTQDEDDEVERQPTPPFKKRRRGAANPESESKVDSGPPSAQEKADETTHDDLDEPSIPTLRRPRTPSVERTSPASSTSQTLSALEPSQPRRKLGKIGGSKIVGKRSIRNDDLNETDDDDLNKSPPSKSILVSSKPARKVKFGTIGGRKAATSHEPQSSVESVTASPSRRAIGKIGGARLKGPLSTASPSPEPSINSPSRNTHVPALSNLRASEAATSQRDPTPPEENTQERVNRRRRELEQELERKRAAPPKKKRRF
ncbi:XLF-domain-containing protein [Patellaria atrata CBS 101060]|uniref:Non-homologous end-joining factor 1 n=1 Tax=Patellaria atrata CBS 101060 TaxID=1346257 RepID=A0A9P4VUT1_9PEZI|nr:XLF-domain-containing protein [Patellaria atrata CBS 101060]